jgi:hypothetical protein
MMRSMNKIKNVNYTRINYIQEYKHTCIYMRIANLKKYIYIKMRVRFRNI